MAATPNGDGYWLAGGDGGVFSLGTAPFGQVGGQQRQTGWPVDLRPLPARRAGHGILVARLGVTAAFTRGRAPTTTAPPRWAQSYSCAPDSAGWGDGLGGGSNLRPKDDESPALTTELRARNPSRNCGLWPRSYRNASAMRTPAPSHQPGSEPVRRRRWGNWDHQT